MKRFITSNAKTVIKKNHGATTTAGTTSRQYSNLPFSHRTAPRFVMPILESIPGLRREDYENPKEIVKNIPKNATGRERIQLTRYIKYLEMREARRNLMNETKERIEKGDKESVEEFKKYRRDVLRYRQKKYILSMDNIRESEAYQKIIDLERKRQKIEAGYHRYNKEASSRAKRVAGIARLSRESVAWITPENIDAHLAKEFSLNRVMMDTSFVGVKGVNDEVQYDLEMEIEMGNYISNKRVNLASRQYRDPMYPEQPYYSSDKVSHINPYSKNGQFVSTKQKFIRSNVKKPKQFPLQDEDLEVEVTTPNTHTSMSLMLHADKLKQDYVTKKPVPTEKPRRPINVAFSMASKLASADIELDLYHEEEQDPDVHDTTFEDEQYLLDTHRLSIKDKAKTKRLDEILETNRKRLFRESGIDMKKALEVTDDDVSQYDATAQDDKKERITMRRPIRIQDETTRSYSTNQSCTPTQWTRLYQQEEKEIRRMLLVAIKKFKKTKIPEFVLERPPLTGTMDHSIALPIFPFKKVMASNIQNLELTPPEHITSKKEKKKWMKQQEDPCATVIAALLPVKESKLVDHVEVKGAYINFHFSPQYTGSVLANDSAFHKKRYNKAKKIMVEFSQPNTHKSFHVGHMRNVAIGDALVQQLKHRGHNVISVNYIGDEGTHIAKCLWYLLYRHVPEKYNIDIDQISELIQSDRRPPNLPERLLELVPSHQTPVEFLGDMYQRGCIELALSNYSTLPYPDWVSGTVEEKLPNGIIVRYNEDVHAVHVPQEDDLSNLHIGDIVGIALPGSSHPISSSPVKPFTLNEIIYSAVLLKENHIKKSSEAILRFEKANEKLVVLGEKSDTAIQDYEKATAQLTTVRSLLDETPKDSIIEEIVKTTKQWSMDDFATIYNWLGVKFDRFYFESKVNAAGKDMVIQGAKKGVLTENEDGMIGINLKELGYCVLLTSSRQGLYATKDLALAKQKAADYGHLDASYLIVDEQQILHFKQVFKTLALLGHSKLSEIQKHIPYGTVRLPSGKMSSRDGTIIPFSVLKSNLLTHMQQLSSQKASSIPSKDYELILHRLAISALKFGMLAQDPSSPIIFDLETWSQPQGNTGPYVIYAYVRIQSILRKSLEQHDSVGYLHPHFQGDTFPIDYHLELFYGVETDWTLLKHPTELRLLQLLHQFHFVCHRVREQDFSHHLLCNYLITVSRMFSRYYEECNILNNTESKEVLHSRLHLLSITSDTLRSGLHLLGINTVSKL